MVRIAVGEALAHSGWLRFSTTINISGQRSRLREQREAGVCREPTERQKQG